MFRCVLGISIIKQLKMIREPPTSAGRWSHECLCLLNLLSGDGSMWLRSENPWEITIRGCRRPGPTTPAAFFPLLCWTARDHQPSLVTAPLASVWLGKRPPGHQDQEIVERVWPFTEAHWLCRHGKVGGWEQEGAGAGECQPAGAGALDADQPRGLLAR